MHMPKWVRDSFIAAVLVALSGCSSTAHHASTTVEKPAVVETNEAADKKSDNSNLNDAASALPPSPSPSMPTLPKEMPPKVIQETVQKTKEPEIVSRTYPNLAVDHIVIVVEENHSYRQIVGSKDAPYFNELISKGALFTDSHGITHPSQPNYLALFSGSTQGMKDDSCGKTYSAPNLASELIQKNLTFAGYSEDLPKAGYNGCSSKGYARKHNPWVQFSNIPVITNQAFADFPQDLSKLPSLSFVIPNHQDDMHDGTVRQADSWLKDHMGAYAAWAESNRSLLIITWDEDDNAKDNHIPTIFVGPMVKPGNYSEKITHYNVLRTVEDLYHLPPVGESAKAEPITSIWRS